ncbi:MAG: hypothetical protein R3E90_08545 [Marinicella sp.]
MSNQKSDSYLLSFNYLPTSQKSMNDVVVPLDVLAQSNNYGEFWIDDSAVSIEQCEEVTKISTLSHLVLIYHSKNFNITQLVDVVYSQAYQISQQLNYPHLLRTWNFFHDINGHDNGLERYQAFCVARHEVLERYFQLQIPNPAATAIGSLNGDNCFVFLFSKQPGQVVENQRQVPAWQYPLDYAPKQPRFSRAMLVDGMLMCSGTASVVGHETVHVNDIKGQFIESLNNIEQLLLSCGYQMDVNAGIYRYYLRNPAQAEILETLIVEQGIESFIILQGDICRENLLLECEVVFQT